MSDTPSHPRAAADTAPTVGQIVDGVARKASLRGLRRALAVNAVVMAREHADRASEPFTQSDADVIMYITELLDKVAETQ